MKVGIVAHDGVVSPRLDQALSLVIVEVVPPGTPSIRAIDISGWPPHGRVMRLTEYDIETVICGGLCSFDEAGFDASSVRLINGVSGPLNAVIDAVCQGTVGAGQNYWTR